MSVMNNHFLQASQLQVILLTQFREHLIRHKCVVYLSKRFFFCFRKKVIDYIRRY